MTFDPDRPDSHVKAIKTSSSRFIRLGWHKVSPYCIKSLCGRFILSKYTANGNVIYVLFDKGESAWRGTDPAEGRRLAAKLFAK